MATRNGVEIARCAQFTIIRAVQARLLGGSIVFAGVAGTFVAGYGATLVVGSSAGDQGSIKALISVIYITTCIGVFAVWRWLSDWAPRCADRRKVFRIGVEGVEVEGRRYPAGVINGAQAVMTAALDDLSMAASELDCRTRTGP